MMSKQQSQKGIAELKELFRQFKNEISMKRPLSNPPLQSLLAARVVKAIDEGMMVLERECERWVPATPTPEKWAHDAFLVHTIEQKLERQENPTIRWVLVSFWVVLGDFDNICAHLEPLVLSNLDELTWLVAGALWVQWGSGQPTTEQLRAALLRIRARSPRFEEYLESAIVSPQDGAKETATIIKRLLEDPTATLPDPEDAGDRGA